MPEPAAPITAPLAGDIARRRAALAMLAFLVALPLCWWLLTRLETLWAWILPLEGVTFMLVATLFGAVLAITPLAAAVGFILSVWFGVESVYLPRTRASSATDRLIVAGGLVVWFSPTLAALAAAARALAEGRIHFVRPPRDYFLATDPIAFWQGVGFWLIMAAVTGFLSWRYWRGKLVRPAKPAHD